MNFTALAENVGLEEDEFIEMAELFVEISVSDLQRLQSAVDQENMKEVVEAAHSIKGASGNMGFMEIYEVTKGLEMNARENKLDGAAEAVGSIKEMLDRIGETIGSD